MLLPEWAFENLLCQTCTVVVFGLCMSEFFIYGIELRVNIWRRNENEKCRKNRTDAFRVPSRDVLFENNKKYKLCACF